VKRVIVTGGNSGVGKAVTTDLPSGSYLAPRFNLWGRPRPIPLRAKACDPEVAGRLWQLSAELTGCDWAGAEQQRAIGGTPRG